jgi:uncharacterized membrane protein
MRFLVAYSTVAMSFAAIDMVWLGIMAERLYRPALGEILRPEPNILPAVFFYLFYPLGLLAFAVLPACSEQSAFRALTSGAMFGCFTYATYDLTNQATLRNWSTTLTLADIGWGSLLAGISAYLGYLAAARMWTGS